MRRNSPLACATIFFFLFAVFHPLQADAKKRKGSLVVYSTTLGAEIFVNGEVVGSVPFEEKIELTPGTYEVELRLRGYSSYMEKVVVRSGRIAEVEIDLIAVDGIVRIDTPQIIDAAVHVDDDVIGSTPFDGAIPAGDHTLRITKPGFEPDIRDLRIQAGKTYNLIVGLNPIETNDDFQTPMPIAKKEEPTQEAFYETWWFWTVAGVAIFTGAATGIALGLEPKQTLEAPYNHMIILPEL